MRQFKQLLNRGLASHFTSSLMSAGLCAGLFLWQAEISSSNGALNWADGDKLGTAVLAQLVQNVTLSLTLFVASNVQIAKPCIKKCWTKHDLNLDFDEARLLIDNVDGPLSFWKSWLLR